jgi:HlyD family secretion protein
MANRKRLIGLAIVASLVACGVVLYLRTRPTAAAHTLTLYGNVDIREVDAAFNDNGRIGKLLVQEGDVVHRGELIALMDNRRFAASLAAARAQATNQQQVLAALLAGSRPETIVQAKAQMDALAFVAHNDQVNYQRYRALVRGQAATRQQRDDALAAYQNAEQTYQAAKQTYTLAVKGPRKEDIAAGEAAYHAAVATAALAEREFKDTRLYAPADGVIEDRILEQGDMASPATPVYTIALTNPIWVRAYVPESDLGKIKLGMAADITTDSYKGRIYHGWIGYLSPTAEFTPKNVETPDLRAQLVYQLRVYACAPRNELRLGMPATVTIDLAQHLGPADQRGPGVCGHDGGH